jgi:hypothetical protein
MNTRRFLEIGGLVAGAVLVVFGVVAIFMGVDARSTVRDSIKQENIAFGSAQDPAVAKYADQWAGQQVSTGDQARAFAKIMREHTMGATGGYTYAQMGRFQAKPDAPKAQLAEGGGTDNEQYAAVDPTTKQPIANGARNIWVTETALTTALNVSYMAENLSLFAIVVGVALLLTGIGFLILALAVFGRSRAEARSAAPARTTAPAAG